MLKPFYYLKIMSLLFSKELYFLINFFFLNIYIETIFQLKPKNKEFNNYKIKNLGNRQYFYNPY